MDLSVLTSITEIAPGSFVYLSFFATLYGIVFIFFEVVTLLIAGWRVLVTFDCRSSLSYFWAIVWCYFFEEFAGCVFESFYDDFFADTAKALILEEFFSFFEDAWTVPAWLRLIFLNWAFSYYNLNFFRLFCMMSKPGRFLCLCIYEFISDSRFWFEGTMLISFAFGPVTHSLPFIIWCLF